MSDSRIKARLALAVGLFVSVPLGALPVSAQTKGRTAGIRIGQVRSGIRVGQGVVTGIRVGQGKKTGLRVPSKQ